MNETLKETIKLVPDQPGCYLYYDKEGEIIYVGKAKNLKRRVYSYFHKQESLFNPIISYPKNLLSPQISNNLIS